MKELCSLSLSQAREKLLKREIGAEEITRAHLERIAEIDPKLNSYVLVTPERALADACESERRLAAGGAQVRPLEGCPIALKDIFVTKDIRSTAASRILHNFIPPYEGTPSGKLAEAGSVLLGKLNMDEFAMGSSNENSAFGPCRNPWDTTRIPGGSSGGSAVAVAAELCLASLGTDTGGSIRQPASLCGIVGLRPTYGRVSRYGVIAFASSLDQVGPFARTVTDAAHMLKAISGHDPHDSTSVNTPVPDYPALLHGELKGRRIGVPKEYFVAGLDPEIESSIRRCIAAMEKEGAEIIDISLPHTEYAIACYYIIAPSEASSNLARYDGVRYGLREYGEGGLEQMYVASRSKGFGAEVKRRIMLGTYCLSAGYYDAYYIKAQKVRTLIAQDFKRAFERVDAIVTPTTPTTAFKIGEKTDDPLQMYLSDIYTVPTNLGMICGISVPCGLDSKGLPIGLQLLGKPFGEAELLDIAYAYEQTLGFKGKPKL